MREIEANPEERARSLSPLVTKLDPSSNSAENHLIAILLGAAGRCVHVYTNTIIQGKVSYSAMQCTWCSFTVLPNTAEMNEGG